MLMAIQTIISPGMSAVCEHATDNHPMFLLTAFYYTEVLGTC